jgi:hypothetical protein
VLRGGTGSEQVFRQPDGVRATEFDRFLVLAGRPQILDKDVGELQAGKRVGVWWTSDLIGARSADALLEPARVAVQELIGPSADEEHVHGERTRLEPTPLSSRIALAGDSGDSFRT